MANKKLKVGGGELKLQAKKIKGEKKPKWQAKAGKKGNVEPVAEVPVVVGGGYYYPRLNWNSYCQLPNKLDMKAGRT